MITHPLETALRYFEQQDHGAALDVLLELHRSNPKDHQANYWIGVIYLMHGQGKLAIEHFAAAAKIAKKDARIFAMLADALSLEERVEEALPHARKAVALDPKSELAHRILGETYARLRRPVMARHAFESAIKLNDTSAMAYLGLSKLLVSTGEMLDATAAYRRALDLAPDEPAILFAAREHADPEIRQRALERIDAALSAPAATLAPAERANLAFTAGKICDDLGDMERAFRFYDGHRGGLYRSYDPKRQEWFFNRFRETFDRNFFETRKHFALTSDKPVFVFGMPRSGTSLVEAILAAHPKAAAAGEVEFFEQEIRDLAGGAYQSEAFFEAARNLDQATAQRIGRKYLALLEKAGGKSARVIDKMPQNFEHLWLIALLFPNAHYCHTARNPADTCASIYMTPLPSRHDYNETQETLAHYYRQYQGLMRHWDEALAVRIRTQSYEDLVTMPDQQRRALVDHIGLPWDDACSQHEKNAAQSFTFSMSQIRKPINTGSVERFRKYENHIRPLLRALGVAVITK